jgi:hypothetical protein
MGAPTDVTPYGFNPQQMNMSEARDVAEERVCACIGIPAAVVGFGAGLQTAKVGATMEELFKTAWRNGVLPVARALRRRAQALAAARLRQCRRARGLLGHRRRARAPGGRGQGGRALEQALGSGGITGSNIARASASTPTTATRSTCGRST